MANVHADHRGAQGPGVGPGTARLAFGNGTSAMSTLVVLSSTVRYRVAIVLVSHSIKCDIPSTKSMSCAARFQNSIIIGLLY